MRICSRNNATIKRIRSLRDRKERERTGLFFVEGIRCIGEAVQLGAAIERFVVAPELLRSEFAKSLLVGQGPCRFPTLEVSAEVFQCLALREGYQGIGAVVQQRWERLSDVRIAGDFCWVALDGVQYPGNLGTILRTCEALGGAGVILIGKATDPYDPVAVRASTGAVFSQHLVRTEWSELIAWSRTAGCGIVGTSPTAASDYRSVLYKPPVVLLMGCEQKGLDTAHQESCDTVVRIPMVGRSDSLNLAIATSIVLCEMFHQRRALRKEEGVR
jgi:TrmH family RNA methyltransferase